MLDDISREDVDRYFEEWRPLVDEKEEELTAAGVPRSEWPEHLHWDWTEKTEYTEGKDGYRYLAIECDKQCQGLLLLQTQFQTSELSDEPIVTVEFLSSAPWNSSEMVGDPKYKLVGKSFMAAAIRVSQEAGCEGRLGLHSLPQSEPFYRDQIGMTDVKYDAAKEMRYFELTAEQATRFIEGEKR
jgi:hypothetical protein